MNTYRVTVRAALTDTIAVAAKSPEDAERVAMLCFMERLKYDEASTAIKELGDGTAVVTAETLCPAKQSDRLDTYVCSGCGESSPKVTFGPGWCKCPRCGAPPLPAVSEVGHVVPES